MTFTAWLAIAIGLCAALPLLTAGYFLGAARRRQARAQLRADAEAATEERMRLQERLAEAAEEVRRSDCAE
jgi:type VI protein secretion system component VasK